MADFDNPGESREKLIPPLSGSDDPSTKLWSIYLTQANQFDQALVERWKGNMDGILIFAGLFSACVTTFLVESYTTLEPDYKEVTVQLLAQIAAQLTTNSTDSGDSEIPTVPLSSLSRETFRPTATSLSVNVLWLLSLSFALACALAATLVEQWARAYLQATTRRPAPLKRARIRSFLYEGLERFNMAAVVEAVPALLHIALFLFFAGLVQFMRRFSTAMAALAFAILLICGLLYIITTLLPLRYPSCPFRTPFSGVCRRLAQVIFRATGGWHLGAGASSFSFTRWGIEALQEIFATREGYKRDTRDLQALGWTLESMSEPAELEEFADGIPGFLAASDSPIQSLKSTHSVMHLLVTSTDLVPRLTGLLASAARDGGLGNEVRRSRAIVCLEAFTALTMSAPDDIRLVWVLDSTVCGTIQSFTTDDNATIVNAAMALRAAFLYRLIRMSKHTPKPPPSVSTSTSSSSGSVAGSDPTPSMLDVYNALDNLGLVKESWGPRWRSSAILTSVSIDQEKPYFAPAVKPPDQQLILGMVSLGVVLDLISSGIKTPYFSRKALSFIPHLARSLSVRWFDGDLQSRLVTTIDQAIHFHHNVPGRTKVPQKFIDAMLSYVSTLSADDNMNAIQRGQTEIVDLLKAQPSYTRAKEALAALDSAEIIHEVAAGNPQVNILQDRYPWKYRYPEIRLLTSLNITLAFLEDPMRLSQQPLGDALLAISRALAMDVSAATFDSQITSRMLEVLETLTQPPVLESAALHQSLLDILLGVVGTLTTSTDHVALWKAEYLVEKYSKSSPGNEAAQKALAALNKAQQALAKPLSPLSDTSVPNKSTPSRH